MTHYLYFIPSFPPLVKRSDIEVIWQWEPEYTPPFHIVADGIGDLGVRFIDFNHDGFKDLIYHRWFYGNVQKGAYIIYGNSNYDLNSPPILDIVGNRSIDEGQLLQFTINATDPDDDTLVYMVSNLPTGASFDPITRLFTWLPDYTQAGLYTVQFHISDGYLTNFGDVVILVNDITPDKLTIDIVEDLQSFNLSLGTENSLISS